MTKGGLAATIVCLAALAAALAYLRDPPWLIGLTSGMGRWETDRAGASYRWMSGHASFFVPSGSYELDVPLRAVFDSPADWAISATITIDDRPADRLVFTDDRWQTARLRLPPKASRRVRRIDVRVDRTRDGNRGLQVGTWKMVNGR